MVRVVTTLRCPVRLSSCGGKEKEVEEPLYSWQECVVEGALWMEHLVEMINLICFLVLASWSFLASRLSFIIILYY